MKKISSVAVVIALVCSEANAFTGTELYRSCQRGPADLSCVAYVRGFVDGMVIGKVVGLTVGLTKLPMFCPPNDGILLEQGRLIVEKFLRDHPERLHEQASFLAANALLDAFPCQNSN
jgi:hypothetical protein